MKEHSELIRAENEKQKEHYIREVGRLQAIHDDRITHIQKQEPKNKIKM